MFENKNNSNYFCSLSGDSQPVAPAAAHPPVADQVQAPPVAAEPVAAEPVADQLQAPLPASSPPDEAALPPSDTSNATLKALEYLANSSSESKYIL